MIRTCRRGLLQSCSAGLMRRGVGGWKEVDAGRLLVHVLARTRCSWCNSQPKRSRFDQPHSTQHELLEHCTAMLAQCNTKRPTQAVLKPAGNLSASVPTVFAPNRTLQLSDPSLLAGSVKDSSYHTPHHCTTPVRDSNAQRLLL